MIKILSIKNPVAGHGYWPLFLKGFICVDALRPSKKNSVMSGGIPVFLG